MEMTTDAAARDKVFDLIKDISVAQLVTVDEAGRLRSRPMVARQESFNGQLWFFTPLHSGKVHEIEQHKEVLLTYSDPKSQTYVSVWGDAQISQNRDEIKELWSEAMRVWFPKGSDDPELAILRVNVRQADYWDTPSSTFVHAYGYAKAVVTGTSPNPGDVKRVQFPRG